MTGHRSPACLEADTWLVDLIYETGEAPEEARRHVDDCEHCSAQLQSLARVRSAAASLPAIDPSDALSERLLAAAEEEIERSRPGVAATGGGERVDGADSPTGIGSSVDRRSGVRNRVADRGVHRLEGRVTRRRRWLAPATAVAVAGVFVAFQLLEGPGLARHRREPVPAVVAHETGDATSEERRIPGADIHSGQDAIAVLEPASDALMESTAAESSDIGVNANTPLVKTPKPTPKPAPTSPPRQQARASHRIQTSSPVESSTPVQLPAPAKPTSPIQPSFPVQTSTRAESQKTVPAEEEGRREMARASRGAPAGVVVGVGSENPGGMSSPPVGRGGAVEAPAHESRAMRVKLSDSVDLDDSASSALRRKARSERGLELESDSSRIRRPSESAPNTLAGRPSSRVRVGRTDVEARAASDPAEPTIAAAIAAESGAVPQQLEDADSMAKGQPEKRLTQAEQAWKEGDLSRAVMLYRQVAESPGISEDQLQTALLGEIRLLLHLGLREQASRRATEAKARLPSLAMELDSLIAPADSGEGAPIESRALPASAP